MKPLFIVAVSFALMLVSSTQVLCEEPTKQEQLSPTDLLKLDDAQTHIREVMLQAQLAIMPHNVVVQEICKTYKIVPCDNLDKIIDMSTGRIRRPLVTPTTTPKPTTAAPTKTSTSKGGTP